MTSPVTGESTNAIFAFTGMLLKLFEQFQPHYVVMAIDTPGKTFRDELYPDYKANRQPPPEELIAQIDRIFEVTRLFGIPLLGYSGAEADDVIATVTHRVLDDPTFEDVKIRIVSKDKDLEQLLDDRVALFDIHTDTTIDVDALKTHKGISPDQVIDVLTLMGDTVDNIPGVEGVGLKTAAKLIREYGSIDALYNHLEQIKGKRRENLEKAREFIPQARQLVTLKRDLDLPFDLADAKVNPLDSVRLKRLFKELGFRRHVNDLDRLAGGDTGPDASCQPDSVTTPSATADNAGFSESLFAPPPTPARIEITPTATTTLASNKSNTHYDIEAQFDDALTTARDFNYRAVTTVEQIDELVETLRGQAMLSIDTETIGLGHRAKLCGICLAWEAGNGVYIPVASPDPTSHLDEKTVLAKLAPVLEDSDLPKCGHNIKYDLLVLHHAGLELQGVAFDSMIAAFLLSLPGRSLDDLALSVLKHETIRISELIGPPPRRQIAGISGSRKAHQKTMDQVPLELITAYAAEDADVTLRLYEALASQLSQQGMGRLSSDVEMPLIEVLTDMEVTGICVDSAVLTKQKDSLATRINDLQDQFNRLVRQFIEQDAKVNIDSPKQLGELLFKQMKLPIVKRTKTGPSTDSEVLEKLVDRDDLTDDQLAVPKLVLEYRQLAKLVNTYLDNLRDSVDPATGRVHASFNQTGAATGRLSSSGPNLQNIPIRTDIGRQIRKAFVANPGPPPQVLISADYSQIELRVLAHLSEDSGLIQAFEEDQDIHTAVASQVFGVKPEDITPQQRTHAKTINFGIIYGVTAYGLARRIDNLNVAGAKVLITDYRQRFPGIDRFLQKCIAQATDVGYVTTMLGRRRPIRQIHSTNANTRNLGERLAINTVVQGSAADLIKLAMVNLYRRINREKLPMKLLLQIHDELVVEAPQNEAQEMAKIVQHEMEHAMTLKVPLKVDAGIGPNWFDAK